MKPSDLNGSNLAFLGDALLSLYVRRYLLEQGYTKAKDLQRLSVKYVSARAQARFMQLLLDESALTEQELEIYKRGRNQHGETRAKNTDVLTYRVATGFEALLGYWLLTDDQARLAEIWERMRATIASLDD